MEGVGGKHEVLRMTPSSKKEGVAGLQNVVPQKGREVDVVLEMGQATCDLSPTLEWVTKGAKGQTTCECPISALRRWPHPRP